MPIWSSRAEGFRLERAEALLETGDTDAAMVVVNTALDRLASDPPAAWHVHLLLEGERLRVRLVAGDAWAQAARQALREDRTWLREIESS